MAVNGESAIALGDTSVHFSFSAGTDVGRVRKVNEDS